MAGRSNRNKLLPVAREGRGWHWSDRKRQLAILDSQGVPEKDIARATGYSLATLRDYRLYTEYREYVEELRSSTLERILPMFHVAQMRALSALPEVIEAGVDMLKANLYVGEDDEHLGREVPNYAARRLGGQMVTDAAKILLGKSVAAGGDPDEIPEGNRVVKLVITDERLQAGGDSSTLELTEGDYTELED